ncbi:ATP-grasp domain-containing protein [Streptomyces sp. NPDC054958]
MSTERESCVAILSDHDDLHALSAQKELRARGGFTCHVVEGDRISARGGLVWSDFDTSTYAPRLPTTDGKGVDLRDVDVLWFRRCNLAQIVDEDVSDPVDLDVINTNTPTALLGVLLSGFAGRWISDPQATFTAENKLVQLRAARSAGFVTPRTLVSNDPKAIRDFCSSLNQRVIVKPLRPSFKAPIFTQRLQPEHLESDQCLRLCPAIYQEYIPGYQHLRVHIFGDYVSAILIEAEDLDWRSNLDVPCRIYDLNRETASCLHQVLCTLNLRMGVVDLKLHDGTPIWLEINPQGQFLFAEGLTGLPLRSAMADFLGNEANSAHRERSLTMARPST